MRRPWFVPVAVFLCVLPLRVQMATRCTLPDDAFITYRYAANLADGKGFVYNRGEPVLGTTTPLLTAFLALAHRAGADIPRTAVALSTAASAAGAALLAAVALATTGSLLIAAAGGALMGLSTYQGELGASGMEAPLLIALMFGSVLLLVRNRCAWGALVAALAALTRPEGFLWWALYGLVLWRTGKLSRVVLAAGLGPIALWFGFAVAYFGSPLPHTVVAKVLQGRSPMAQLAPPWRMFEAALGPRRYLLVVLAAPVLMARHDQRLALPVVFSAIFLAAYGLARPMMYTWYAAPLDAAVGLMLVAVLDGALRLWDAPAPPRRQPYHRLWTVCVIASFLLLISCRAQHHRALLFSARMPEPRVEFARALGRHTLPQDTILVGDIGYLGYYNLDRHIVDYYGLVWKAPRQLMAVAMARTISNQWATLAIATVQPTVCLLGQPDRPMTLGDQSRYALEEWPDLPGWAVLRRVGAGPPPPAAGAPPPQRE